MPVSASPRPLMILACFDSASLARSLDRTARRFGTVVRLNDRRLLRKQIFARRPAVVVFPLVDERGIPTHPIVEWVLRDAPEAVTVICVPPDGPTHGLARALAIGAQLLTWATDAQMQPAIAALFRRVTAKGFDQREVDALLAELTPATMTEVLRRCTSLAHRRLAVGTLASALGVSRRTLNRTTRRAGWPPPSELIMWGRLLRASAMHWHGAATPASIARRAGFRDPAALAQTVERHVGVGTTLDDLSPLRLARALQQAMQIPTAASLRR